MKKIIFTAAVLALAIASASGAPKTKVQKVRVAHTSNYVPYDFVNEKGESDGFEVAVLKEVDRLLPEYEFEYHPTSDDDLLIGVLQGKYAFGTKGIWVTEERKKKYAFPKNPIGASVIGIVIRSETADQIHDLPSFAKYSGKLVPIGAANAQYAVIDDYNKSHPNAQVKLVAGDQFGASDGYIWVAEGRYDAFVAIKLSFENNVLKDGAAYSNLRDKLKFITYKGIPTWPIFNKKQQKLADAYDRAIEQLLKDGTVSRLAIKYFGEDVSALLNSN